ncbi:hypothetical protein [Leptospira idonii]|uniref:Uncharacterized protein n=1 Tax=Leptospira idonii TaxID=1193500 RepID=A0A4R9LWB7_9LEPT|nr:hypothetical protein [Leptospira idonii]TGN18564.1 hypothetical protein EHS15_14355 [Leptospira idonii]
MSSIIVTKYIHKIKLPNGSFFFLESYKAYENEFPIYFDPEDQMNYKAIETNDSLLNVILFAIGIVMIFYTNYKAGYFYEKADDLENYEHKRNRRLRRHR